MASKTKHIRVKSQFGILIITLLLAAISSLNAQNNNYPPDYFIPPLDGQLLLSGTFGELRSNHFHAGIDIKTGGAEGKPVYAIADGYISRIKVSTGGYGKALYITHANGYVSVYGHLQRFNDTLQKYIRNYQYEKERFVVEKFPAKDELLVKKGKLIAYSGNTGGSTAPHLHFEIREESTQHPVNPLLFKSIGVTDFYRPKIHEVAIYPVDGDALINGKNDTVFFRVGGWGEGHYLTGKPKITVSGKASFGIRCHDPMNDVPNKNGVYTIDFFRDSTWIFGLEMDKISFATTRYLNSLIDYGYFKKKKRRVVRTQVDTNNRLLNYRGVLSNGIMEFSDSAVYQMKYLVKDVYGNTSKLDFEIRSSIGDSADRDIKVVRNSDTRFQYNKINKFEKDDIRLSFPANAFYRSFDFQFSSKAGDSSQYSLIYTLHNKYTPVQKSFSISIKPTHYPEKSRGQLYIAVLGNNGSNWYIGSKWERDRITAKSRLLGKYVVMADTINPEIEAVNVYDGKDISGQTSIKVKIRDRETGIKRFRATLNDRWILMEYESKKRLLFYNFDDRLTKGENNLKVVVSDLLGNETVYEALLMY